MTSLQMFHSSCSVITPICQHQIFKFFNSKYKVRKSSCTLFEIMQVQWGLCEHQNICLRRYVSLAISKYSSVWPPTNPTNFRIKHDTIIRYRPNRPADIVKLLKRALLKSWPKYGPEYVTEISHGFSQVLHEVANVFPYMCHDLMLPAHSPTILPLVEYATSQMKRKINEE